MAIEYYTVAAETGSCSEPMDEVPEMGDGLFVRWEQRATCGHKHKTREAAGKCRDKLTRRSKNGECSALWYGAKIHDQDGHRV